jgi:hypothetical protein
LQRRTGIAGNLAVFLSQSTIVDKEQLGNSKLFAIDLYKYLDTLTFKDSLSISFASDKNSRLTQALARILITLENDKKLRSDNQLLGLFMQLEGCENKIALAKQAYNEACKKYKRIDLLFDSDNVEEGPEVKF